jgi:TPR repeat protein
MYHTGEGVLQDYAEAVRWYKLAAAQGVSKAQHNLASMYYEGKGVVQDYLQAHMWMNLAAVSGKKDAQKARDVIAAKMTSQQIGKAQAMAKKCLASKFKDCG